MRFMRKNQIESVSHDQRRSTAEFPPEDDDDEDEDEDEDEDSSDRGDDDDEDDDEEDEEDEDGMTLRSAPVQETLASYGLRRPATR